MPCAILWLLCFVPACSADSYSLGSAEAFFSPPWGLPVYFMQQDQNKDGLIIMSTDSLLFTTDGTTIHAIAGSNGSTGYTEGSGKIAQFNSVRCFVQRGTTEILAADFYNHCLRTVDRITNSTKLFAGNCTVAGYVDGFKDQALFNGIYGLILDGGTIFATDHQNSALRKVDLESNQVITIAKEDRALSFPQYLVREVDGSFIVSTLQLGLVKVGPETGNVFTLTAPESGLNDGPLWNASFNDAKTLFWIDKTTLIIADTENSRIRTMSTKRAEVSTLSSRNNDRLFPSVWSLTIANGFLFVGQRNEVQKILIYHSADGENNTVPILSGKLDLAGNSSAPGIVIGLSIVAAIMTVSVSAATIMIIIQRRAISKLRIAPLAGITHSNHFSTGYDDIMCEGLPNTQRNIWRILSRPLPTPIDNSLISNAGQNGAKTTQGQDGDDTTAECLPMAALQQAYAQETDSPADSHRSDTVNHTAGYENELRQVSHVYGKVLNRCPSPDSVTGESIGTYVQDPAMEYD